MDTLETAIQLREEGRDEEARQMLFNLLQSQPDNPLINYHCAWIHDKLGLEKEAIPFYERAIELGLNGNELKGAMLGLGSTYRCLGEYHKAEAVLRRGAGLFPDNKEFDAFLGMTLYNLKSHYEAVQLLIKTLAETSSDSGIIRYKRALLFYADNLDETWG